MAKLPKRQNEFKHTVIDFDPESTMNDLRKIVEGPGDIDFSDRAVIACLHFKSQGFISDIVCRPCFLKGYDSARSVASGAFMLSQISTHKPDNGDDEGSLHTVIYQTETSSGMEMKEEIYFQYHPHDSLAALRYLSLHTANVDPRIICMNPDLYWSIINFYGSITKALKLAGGQRLYDIGFGKHKLDVPKVLEIMELNPLHFSLQLSSSHQGPLC